MAKLTTSTALLFLFAALIGYYAFALPLLQRDFDQLESDLEFFFGDTASISNAIASLDLVIAFSNNRRFKGSIAPMQLLYSN